MLYDTSALIDYFRQNNQSATFFMELACDGLISAYCSVITEAEVFVGVRNRRERAEIESLLSKFQIIPVTSSIARLAGNLLSGKDVDQIKAHFGDALIAASAIEAGETILTADGRSQRVFGNQANYLVYK